MDSWEIVTKAIEFKNPPRLPFFLGGTADEMQSLIPDLPNDVCDVWEMDRAKAGWFFDNTTADDWGCGWSATQIPNMGQVTYHPLNDWSKLEIYRPPNPRDPFYFERLYPAIDKAAGRYVCVTSHFSLFERLHMLRGFSQTLEDFYLEIEKINKTLDMILEFKLAQFDELFRRFPGRIHGIFMTDDWGTQIDTFISPAIFENFFLQRYQKIANKLHSNGCHFILHSCGRVNNFVPYFIKMGVDVLNMQQPKAYGIEEIGDRFAGKVCFLTTVDIQQTLTTGDDKLVIQEAHDLVEKWSTPKGGFIVFNYGMSEATTGIPDRMNKVMFQEFFRLAAMKR